MSKGLKILPILLLWAMLLTACGGGRPVQTEAGITQNEEAAEQPAQDVSAPGPSAVPEETQSAEINETAEEEAQMRLFIGETEVSVHWEENESVAALREIAAKGPLTVAMSMYGGFEQVGSLGASLPRNDIQTSTQAGDIMLYSGSQIVIFYGSNSWAYTRLGKIIDRSAADLAVLLDRGDTEISISLE